MLPRAHLQARLPPPPWQMPEDPDAPDPDFDDDGPLELDDEAWEVFIPDDDYEPLPEYGDFWTDDDPSARGRGTVAALVSLGPLVPVVPLPERPLAS